MTTTRLNTHDAGTILSARIAALKPGDRIILWSHDRPVAEIRPLDERLDEPRPVGLGKGLADIPESFFDPLPNELVDPFDGR